VIQKKLLSSLILLTLAVSVLSAIGGNMAVVSGGVYPAIYVDPPLVEDIMPPNTFTVSIKTDYTGSDITGWQFVLYYKPSVLHGVSVTNGDLIVGGSATFKPPVIDNTNGKLSAAAFFFFVFEPAPLTSGPGTLATVTFEVVGMGESLITIGTGIGETKLKGYTDDGYGDPYDIIDGFVDEDHLQHGKFRNVEAPPDIAVLSVTPNDTEVIENDLVEIAVEVKNLGTATETFDVSTYYDLYSLIETKTGITLAGETSTTLTFIWDTTNVAPAIHSLRAVASTVPGETNTENNKLTSPLKVTVVAGIVAIIIAPDEGYPGEPVTFDASASYSLRGHINGYIWDFGDGTIETVTSPTVKHTYKWTGIYAVWLWVTDNTGEKSDPAYRTMPIVYPPSYIADLVQWKVKPEAHHWVESKDDNGLITLTALAKNQGTRPINIRITFAILNARGGDPAGPVVIRDLTILNPGEKVPVSVELNPYDYGYEEEKMVLFAYVTLKYDSDADGTPDTDASTKVLGFTVLP